MHVCNVMSNVTAYVDGGRLFLEEQQSRLLSCPDDFNQGIYICLLCCLIAVSSLPVFASAIQAVC